MAVKRILRQSTLTSDGERLVNEIRAEIRRPNNQPPKKGAPVVIVEEDNESEQLRYFVVWDTFRGVGHETRTKIVSEAVRLESPGDYRNIAVALGLTRDEAEKLDSELKNVLQN